MWLDSLKARLPDDAKGHKLNLGSLATEPSLTAQQRAGTIVASALASRNAEVTATLVAEFSPCAWRPPCMRWRRCWTARPRWHGRAQAA